jgi:phytoene/squalene synthetase
MIHELVALTHARPDEAVERRVQDVSGAPATADYLKLPARITKAASKQAYYTIRYLVDHDRKLAAYRAYAYFRWVDDWLDQPVSERARRLAFVRRQGQIVDWAYQTGSATMPCDWSDLAPEERLLVDLIASQDQCADGLHAYITNMMAVMAFDANRRGRLVTSLELARYTQHLSVAVTEALHYFIGHQYAPPPSQARYFPAMGAHITHMLRDTFEDVELGYFNAPSELLESSGMGPQDVASADYRDWVSCRVHLARAYFRDGASYLDECKSVRCRLAGYAYMARFTGVLDTIEREGYRLRPRYTEFSQPKYAVKVASSVALRTILRGQL